MSTITRLVYSKSGNSVRIYIDDKYAFSLSPNEVVRQKIDKDQVISPSKLKQLKHSGDYEKNYLKALNLISYRPRSAQEIKQYLHRNSVSPLSSPKLSPHSRNKTISMTLILPSLTPEPKLNLKTTAHIVFSQNSLPKVYPTPLFPKQ